MRETRQSGSEGGVRLIPHPYPYPMRSWARLPWLMVDQSIEHVVHHAELVVAFILSLHVHQILIQRVETGGQHPGDAEARFRRGREKLLRIFDDGEGARFQRANRGVVGAAQQNTHLAEDGTRLGYFCNPYIVPQDFNLPLDEHKQPAAYGSLFNDKATGIKILNFVPRNQF